MGKAAAILLVLLGLVWYHASGPGANGRSPYGTARALVKTAMAGECAALMEERFPAAAGARALCTPELARALRTQVGMAEVRNDGYAAEVEVFYGST